MKYEITYKHTVQRCVEVDATSLFQAIGVLNTMLNERPIDADKQSVIVSEKRRISKASEH